MPFLKARHSNLFQVLVFIRIYEFVGIYNVGSKSFNNHGFKLLQSFTQLPIGLNWLASYEYILLVPGTTAFLRSISLEAVGLGVHLAAGAHDILLQAECLFTSIAPSVPWPVPSKLKTNVRSNQPKDAQQGIQQVNISTCYNWWYEWFALTLDFSKYCSWYCILKITCWKFAR